MNRHLNQHGSVLIIALLVMLMLTILAVTEIMTNSAQTRIATNSGDAQAAFQTAEGAIEEVTNNLLAGSYPATNFLANSNGFYIYNPNNPNLWSTIDWNNASMVISGYKGESNSASSFIIEQLPSIISSGQSASTPAQVYRITVRATGQTGGPVVVLQRVVLIQY